MSTVIRPEAEAQQRLGSVVLSAQGITKTFDGKPANDGVDFVARCGEVHALLGENGAGKTTLISVLCGQYRPDAGEIEVAGEPRRFHSPRDALRAGIGVVHQDLRQVERFSVVENVVLGTADRVGREAERRVAEIAGELGFGLDPRAIVATLSVGERQQLEVVKLLYRGMSILILDEPTAVLAPQQSAQLFDALRRLADEGKAVVFITHRLREVTALADVVTVLRDGRVVANRRVEGAEPHELARLMVGEDAPGAVVAEPGRASEPVLELAGAGSRTGRRDLHDVDLVVRRGEIVGVAGVSGNGQVELAELASGMLEPDSGTRRMHGRSLAFIPEDRLATGLVGAMSVADNLAFRRFHRPPMSTRLWLRRTRVREHARALIDRFRIPTRNIRLRVGQPLGRRPAKGDRGARDYGGPGPARRRSANARARRRLRAGGPCPDRRRPRRRRRRPARQRGPRRAARAVRPHRGDARRADRRRPSARGGQSHHARAQDDGRRRLMASRFEKRTDISRAARIAVPVVAVAGGLAFGALILLLGGHSVGDAYRAMWDASFGTSQGFEQTLVRATPLLLTGLAVTVALRMNVWNIGAEGQMALGAIGATFVAFHADSLGRFPLLLLMFLGGAIAAGGWAMIAAVPRAAVGLNEIITTLFLNYIGLLLLSALINGPWKDPTAIGFAYSRPLPTQAALPLIGTTNVTVGIYIALGAALVLWWLLDRTRLGFSLSIAGGNVRAAHYLRLGVGRRIVFVLVLSGALAGIGGVIQLTAASGRLQDGLTGNYGYTGILVAFLARQRVIPTVVVAVLFAGLLAGGSALQSTGIPSSIAQIVQAVIIIFVLGGEVLGGYRPRSAAARPGRRSGRAVEAP